MSGTVISETKAVATCTTFGTDLATVALSSSLVHQVGTAIDTNRVLVNHYMHAYVWVMFFGGWYIRRSKW